jgi:hypothetical protein
LDHIVYALVDGRTADRRILRKIDFPIYGREDLFGQSKGVGHLRALLPTDQFREILVSQPFKRCCEAPESDWLWVLHELDNIDKHRPILVVDPRLMIKRRHADGTVSVVKQPLVAGAEGLLPAVTLPADPPELSGQERSIVVVLAETGLRCDNITVRQVWRDMVSEVKAIIDRFERLLL